MHISKVKNLPTYIVFILKQLFYLMRRNFSSKPSSRRNPHAVQQFAFERSEYDFNEPLSLFKASFPKCIVKGDHACPIKCQANPTWGVRVRPVNYATSARAKPARRKWNIHFSLNLRSVSLLHLFKCSLSVLL